MELYEKKGLKENDSPSQGLHLPLCVNEVDKENLFKEIYSNIQLFDKLVYEAMKK